MIDLIKLDGLLDKLALDVQCDGIEFGNDNWILNWNLLWRRWQLCWKFQNLFYLFTSGFLLGSYSCIVLIRLILCFFWFLLLRFELGKFWFLKFMFGCWSIFLYVYAYVYVGFTWCNIDMCMLGCWSFCICLLEIKGTY